MEALGFDNIMGAEEIDTLFSDPEDIQPEETGGENGNKQDDNPDDTKKNGDTAKQEATEVNPEDLFGEEEEKPESVGSGKTETEGKGDSSTEDGGGTSPKNFYSSIANAMAEDGIFPNLDEETLSKVVDAETLSDAIEAEIKARYDEGQQRILDALKNGVEPSEIRNYENTLNYISSIKDTDITAETPEAEQLRYQLITQDLLNRGYSREAADKRARRSIDAGNDIEDAKDALQSNKEYFQNEYDKLLKDAEAEAEAEKKERQKQTEKLKDSILKDKTLMGDMEISSDLRKKALDNISKPVYKDPETGEYMTALQKYQHDNPADFLKYVGLVMTLTNGFKDFEGLYKGKVKKETKKGLAALEQTLSNTRRDSNGNLKMVTNAKDDPESFLSGFKLDI